MTAHNYQESLATPEHIFDEPGGSRGHHRQSGSPFGRGSVIAALIGVLIVGMIGGFVAGMQVGKSSKTTSANGFGGMGSQSQQGGLSGRRMGAFGTVTAVSDSSISIKDQMQDSTKTYAITSSTTVTDNGSSASVSDIQVGDTVMIRTASSSSSSSSSTSSTSSGDSSTTATSIELNPSMQGGPGGQSQNSTSSSSN